VSTGYTLPSKSIIHF